MGPGLARWRNLARCGKWVPRNLGGLSRDCTTHAMSGCSPRPLAPCLRRELIWMGLADPGNGSVCTGTCVCVPQIFEHLLHTGPVLGFKARQVPAQGLFLRGSQGAVRSHSKRGRLGAWGRLMSSMPKGYLWEAGRRGCCSPRDFLENKNSKHHLENVFGLCNTCIARVPGHPTGPQDGLCWSQQTNGHWSLGEGA